MKKITASLIILLTCVGVIHGQRGESAYALTLEECIAFAMGNFNRQTYLLNERSREISYDQSKMERLPGLNASLSENVSHVQGNQASWTGNYGLDGSVVIYQGGYINNTIEQNRLYTEQAGYQTQQYDNQLTINILQNFLSILGYEEMLKYQRSVLRASEEQLTQGKAQYGVGMILESDYLLLEAQYANDSNNIIETINSRNNSLLTLKGLLSMDMDTELMIIYPDTAMIEQLAILPSENYVVDRALTTMPDIDLIRTSVEIAETNLKLARSSFFPTISLGGGIGTGHNTWNSYGNQLTDRFNQNAGVSVSIPIFNKGRTRANVRQSEIALLQTELEKEQTRLDVTQTVLQEYNDVATYYNRYETSRIRESAYRKSFEVYRVQFELGSITAVDLLQQQNNYISALNEYIQSKYGFILRRKVLDVYMGINITM